MNKYIYLFIFIVSKSYGMDIQIGVLIGDKKPGIEKTRYTENFYRGALLAEKHYSERLKQNNINLKFKIYEMQDDPIKNYYPVKKAISDGVDVLVGPSSSYFLPGISLALQDSKSDLVVVSPYSTSKLISNSEKMTSMLNMNVHFGSMLTSFMNKKYPSVKFSVVCADDVETSKVHCDTLDSSFKSEENYLTTNKELSNIDEIIKHILEKKVEVVITPNRIPISGVLIKELTKRGYRGVFIGSSALGEITATGLLDVVGHKKFMAYALRQNSVHDLKKNGKYKAEIASLTEKWGYPRLTSLLFFDAVAMVIESALKNKDKFVSLIRENKAYKGILADKISKEKAYRVIKIDKGIYQFVGRFLL